MDESSEPKRRGHPGGVYNTPLAAWLTAHPSVTARVLAEEAGITETYVGHVRRGLKTPSFRVMYSIERATQKIESASGVKDPVGVTVASWASFVRASDEKPKKRGARGSKAVGRST